MLDLVEKTEEKHTVDRGAGIKIIKGRKTAVKSEKETVAHVKPLSTVSQTKT